MNNKESVITKIKLLGYNIDTSQKHNDWVIVYKDKDGNRGFVVFENYLYISKPIYISVVVYDSFVVAAVRNPIGEYSIYNRYRNINLVNSWRKAHYSVINTNDGEMLLLRNTTTGCIYAVNSTGMKKLIYKSRVSYNTRIEATGSDLGGMLLGVSEQHPVKTRDSRLRFKETVYRIGIDLSIEQIN